MVWWRVRIGVYNCAIYKLKDENRKMKFFQIIMPHLISWKESSFVRVCAHNPSCVVVMMDTRSYLKKKTKTRHQPLRNNFYSSSFCLYISPRTQTAVISRWWHSQIKKERNCQNAKRKWPSFSSINKLLFFLMSLTDELKCVCRLLSFIIAQLKLNINTRHYFLGSLF